MWFCPLDLQSEYLLENDIVEIRQCKYLNNTVEQDHRFIKWRIQQGLGFKDFESARRTLTGIEIVHMIKKKVLSH